MTDITASGRSKHATLTAATVDRVTLDRSYGMVEIVNRSTTATDALYVLVDRGATGYTNPDPTVAGDGTYYIAPGAVRVITDDTQTIPGVPATVVRLISASAVPYSVTGI